MTTLIELADEYAAATANHYLANSKDEALWKKMTDARASVVAGIEELQAEVERLRVQLAGCGVAAMQNTENSKAQRVEKGTYGWSESYADVCRAVDREIALRAELDALKAQEPVAYLWAPRKKPELAKLSFQAQPSASLKALGYVSKPLFAGAAPQAPAPVKAEPTKRQFDLAMQQWEQWKQYALELQERLVKYEGGAPMHLNAAQPAAPQAPAPLTDEHIFTIGYKEWKDSPLLSFQSAFKYGVRFAEKAHNITGEAQG